VEKIRIGHLHIIVERRMKMKADDIRDQNEPARKLLKDAESGQESVGYMTVLVLGEIAAQLAEMNFTLSCLSGARTPLLGCCIKHNVDRVFWRGFHYCPACFPHIHEEALADAQAK